MDPIKEFEYVQILWTWLTPILTIALLLIPRPRRFWVRCVWAICAGWLCTVLFTVLVYNPSGIAAGHALGQDFPEGRFDNNTSGVAIFFGWLCPTIIVMGCAGIRAVRQQFRGRGA